MNDLASVNAMDQINYELLDGGVGVALCATSFLSATFGSVFPFWDVRFRTDARP